MVTVQFPAPSPTPAGDQSGATGCSSQSVENPLDEMQNLPFAPKIAGIDAHPPVLGWAHTARGRAFEQKLGFHPSWCQRCQHERLRGQTFLHYGLPVSLNLFNVSN